MHFSIFLILLFLGNTITVFEINAAKINQPVVTKYINDISGSDVFKTTVGITNIGTNTGLVEICVKTSQSDIEKICDVIDAGKKFLNDFGKFDCPTCIITMGTFVFPAEKVPINTEITACATLISRDGIGYSCNTTLNKQDPIPEDIIIELNQ
jgi:hypothetical protein